MIKLTRFYSNTHSPVFAEAHGRTVYINEKLILSVETVFPYTVRSAADLNLPLKEKSREKATQITYAFGIGEEPFSETVQESAEEVLRRSAIGAGGQAVAEVDGSGIVQTYEWWDKRGGNQPGTKLYTHPADEQVVEAQWREIEINNLLKGRRRSPAYFPATGEECEVSGPNCDDDTGYTWATTTVLWQSDIFVLYGQPGFWPVLHKHEHVLFRPLSAKEDRKNG